MATTNLFGNVLLLSPSPPPKKIPFKQRRDRQFLYLHEIDALIAALAQTRAATRNTAMPKAVRFATIALLLFCQALQPAEACCLRWHDIDFAENIFRVARLRALPASKRQPSNNLQPLCAVEIDILQQLYTMRVNNWLFASERQTRLAERSLHHLIQQAGKTAEIPFPIHPYMLRTTGLYYRSALLLQSSSLSLRQCCLLWNWHGTQVAFSPEQEQEYQTIAKFQEDSFLAAIRRLRAFTGIGHYQNVIDYLLGAYALFPRLQGIPQDYWLSPVGWQ
ncbi:integrase [cyanobacterium TDX16]|nr:integrase [cyanobacterium TDX16]